MNLTLTIYAEEYFYMVLIWSDKQLMTQNIGLNTEFLFLFSICCSLSCKFCSSAIIQSEVRKCYHFNLVFNVVQNDFFNLDDV